MMTASPFDVSTALSSFLKEKGLDGQSRIHLRPSLNHAGGDSFEQSMQTIREHNKMLLKKERGSPMLSPMVQSPKQLPSEVQIEVRSPSALPEALLSEQSPQESISPSILKRQGTFEKVRKMAKDRKRIKWQQDPMDLSTSEEDDLTKMNEEVSQSTPIAVQCSR
ncbi:hypothetical protein PROFUN_06747 [Planoprotostelium fungivorum]|uniref:Uncharacterized protein n=1 Tax=Planoprotostelium fungivorum TaxID=1890364 RepID=A0A2P6NNI2_9EUKA|nr:hypothetical protein PROFUN_06747 [Planoprotostelium fungivorum]